MSSFGYFNGLVTQQMSYLASVMAWSSSKVHTTELKTGKQDGECQNDIKLSCFNPKCHAKVPDKSQWKVEKSS